MNVVVFPSGLPVTVIREVPMGVEALVAIVSVLGQVGLQEVGLKVAVAPVGKPEAARETAWVVPETSVAVRVVVPEVPWATLTFPELARV